MGDELFSKMPFDSRNKVRVRCLGLVMSEKQYILYIWMLFHFLETKMWLCYFHIAKKLVTLQFHQNCIDCDARNFSWCNRKTADFHFRARLQRRKTCILQLQNLWKLAEERVPRVFCNVSMEWLDNSEQFPKHSCQRSVKGEATIVLE